MEGCSGVGDQRASPKEVVAGLWDVPPPAVLEYLLRDGDTVPTLRLVNSNWCEEANEGVKRIDLSPSLSVTGIENWVVALLTKFPRIDTIKCTRYGTLKAVADHFPGKVFHLEAWVHETHEWEMLPRFGRLETLVVRRGGPHNDLAHLSAVTTLKELQFQFIRHGLENTDGLTRLTNLQKLALSYSKIKTLQFVELLTGLVELRLHSHPKQGLDYGVMSALTNLTSLDLCGMHFGDGDDASFLSSLVNLRKLELDHTKISDSGFFHVAHLTNLRHLRIEWVNLTETGLSPIAYLRDLEHLHIVCRAMHLENGLFLDPLARLRVLNMSGLVHNDVLQSIATLESLTNLRVNVTLVTNDAFSLLGNLSQLETLRLDKAQNPYEGGVLLDLGCMPQLMRLELWGDGWVNESLVNLSRMENLEKFAIRSDSITDGGMQHVTKLENLEHMVCHSRGVSKECMQNLRERFPIFERWP